LSIGLAVAVIGVGGVVGLSVDLAVAAIEGGGAGWTLA
jgi:hypothetical protein